MLTGMYIVQPISYEKGVRDEQSFRYAFTVVPQHN